MERNEIAIYVIRGDEGVFYVGSTGRGINVRLRSGYSRKVTRRLALGGWDAELVDWVSASCRREAEQRWLDRFRAEGRRMLNIANVVKKVGPTAQELVSAWVSAQIAR